jgi:hypothetical protein
MIKETPAFLNRLSDIAQRADAEALALEVFQFQAENVPVYNEYLRHLNIQVNQITTFDQIPFLPIETFKHHPVMALGSTPAIEFRSSGTTGQHTSTHSVADLDVYRWSALRSFELRFGSIQKYAFFFLLPSYLERPDSSLIWMAQMFLEQQVHGMGGFYLQASHDLLNQAIVARENGLIPILWGVTFALVEWAGTSPQPWPGLVLETGGMKGRGPEWIRPQLHSFLSEKLGVATIQSEYGMTEMLSQAYSESNGMFLPPPWLLVRFRDPLDPLSVCNESLSGAINVVDLANLYSCSFLATGDLGKVSGAGFEVLGRLDHHDARGCNLMLAG